MAIKYEHTQPGGWVRYFVIFTVLITIAILGIVFTKIPFTGKKIAISVGLLAIAPLPWVIALVWSLTLTIDNEYITLTFGPGAFWKKFPLKDIVSCQSVKNNWSHGWGIHKCKGGWVYNIAGFDAVEITMSNGKKNRIGTDEPEKLADTITNAIKKINKKP